MSEHQCAATQADLGQFSDSDDVTVQINTTPADTDDSPSEEGITFPAEETQSSAVEEEPDDSSMSEEFIAGFESQPTPADHSEIEPIISEDAEESAEPLDKADLVAFDVAVQSLDETITPDEPDTTASRTLANPERVDEKLAQLRAM
jgi:hypothetical protein